MLHKFILAGRDELATRRRWVPISGLSPSPEPARSHGMAARISVLEKSAPLNSRGSPERQRVGKAAASPDYLVLLDGPDVMPHIVLTNPLPNDGDMTVDSNLPYASPAIFSRRAARYLKVTRVVGCVPSAPGATTPVSWSFAAPYARCACWIGWFRWAQFASVLLHGLGRCPKRAGVRLREKSGSNSAMGCEKEGRS